MTTTRQNVPALRFPDFKTEWRFSFLGELGSLKNGINKDKNDFGHGFSFVNLLDVFGKTSISTKTKLGLVNVNQMELKNYNLLKGDVLFIRSSVKRSGVGETIVVSEDLPNAVYSGFLIRFRRSKPILDAGFMYYCFWIENFRKKLLSLSSTSANTNINQESLNTVKVSYPSTEEQQKIATFLSSVDTKIEQLNRKKALLSQYKKGMLQKLFSQEIRFKDERGKEYSEWEEVCMGDICRVQGGYAFKSINFLKQGIPIIRISNISNDNNFVNEEDLVFYKKLDNQQQFTIKSGDLLIAMSGATTGKSSIYNLPYDAYLNQRVGLFRAKKMLNYDFLTQFVFSNLFVKQLKSVLVAGAQPNISSKDIEKLLISLPRFQEQQKIAAFLSAIDRKIELVSEQLKQAQTFKKGLFQQMFI